MSSFELQLTGGFLEDDGQRAGFVLLAAFLASFLFIRTSARLIRDPKVTWWPGNVETRSGLHLHHMVWGVTLLLLCGFLSIALAPPSPWSEVLAAAFGIGAGLTLDEFALIVYVRDVYWTQEGRASLDATVIATLLAGLVVLGVAPFDLGEGGSVAAVSVVALLVLAVAVTAILKGKLALGLVGLFVPLIGLVAALRLAKPGSWWARRRYPADGERLRRAKARQTRLRATQTRWMNRIGGAPSR